MDVNGPTLDEIAEYYRDKEDDISSSYAFEETNEAKEDTCAEYELADEKIDTPLKEKKISVKLFQIFAGASLFILLFAFIAGFAKPKAEEDINFALARMHTSSKKYTDAQNKLIEIEAEIAEITKQIETNQASLTAITDFESNTGELKSALKVLTDELDGLNKEIEIHKKNIDKIDKSISMKTSTSYNLTPGIYTVGKNINENNYNIKGNGIISISDKAGNLKVNTTLSGSEFSVELVSGDIVKLETKASLSPIAR